MMLSSLEPEKLKTLIRFLERQESYNQDVFRRILYEFGVSDAWSDDSELSIRLESELSIVEYVPYEGSTPIFRFYRKEDIEKLISILSDPDRYFQSSVCDCGNPNPDEHSMNIMINQR